MGELRTRLLLRECVREMLTEDDGGFGGGYGDSGTGLGDAQFGMGFGAHFGSEEQLYNIFVKPFVDVVKTTAGKTKEMSRQAQELVSVAFETVATTLIPFLSSDFDKIFAKGKQDLEKIESQYADVYKANWDAFKNKDLLIAAFAYRPDLFLTAKFAKTAPKAAASLLSVLSGGALDRALMQMLGKTKKKGNKDGDNDLKALIGKMFSDDNGHGSLSDGRLREDDTEGQVNDPTPLQRLVTNSKVKEILANNPKVQQMSQSGQHLVQGMLKDVFGHAQNVLSSKSIDDLQRKLGKKVPGAEKLDKVPDAERQKAEQLLLGGVKKSMKALYLKNLEAQVKEAVSQGVPKDHPFVSDYLKVISKIKAL